jgi:sec-independent protein translocase protein TatC
VGHLGELRKRFTYIAIAVIVCMIAAFIEKDYVLAILERPLRGAGFEGKLAVLGVTEGFMQILKISIYAGLLISLPFILYQFWAFVMPALYENEKRSTVPYVAFTTALFLAGVAFGYLVVLPVGLRFMVGYGGEYFNQLFQAERYFSFVSMFLLAFGCVFELPLIMMLLSWAGIVNHKQMRKMRKYAILVEAVIAMIFTPSQDPLSMALMLIPLILLYEFGIWLARIAVARREKRQALAALAEQQAAENQLTDAQLAEAQAADGAPGI